MDGIIGRGTLGRVLSKDARTVIGDLTDLRMRHYMTVPGKEQREKYGKGWSRRTREMYLDAIRLYEENSDRG